MRRFTFLFLSILTSASLSYAETECLVKPNTIKDVLLCAEARSPEIQNALLEVELATSRVQGARQWKNPEFSAETFQGKSGSESLSETDLALQFPIELGGKLAARTSAAEGGVRVAEAKLHQARAKVHSEVLLKLHRLRQVIHEQEIVNEAIGTFSKLVSQYSSRPTLSPEQQLTSSVFQLSKSEYDLKRAETADEILDLDSFFKLVIGLNSEQLKQSLPESPKSWPKIKNERANQVSPELTIRQAETDAAKTELSAEKSEAWPSLTLGPSLKIISEAGQSNTLLGLNISLPLPVFNANGGGIAAATANLKISEARQRSGLIEQEIKRDELIRSYELSIKTLSSSLSHREIERRHSDVERLFLKGVVPSALVIEAHRISLELEKLRHERELKALDAFFDLSTVDGKIFEVSL